MIQLGLNFMNREQNGFGAHIKIHWGSGASSTATFGMIKLDHSIVSPKANRPAGLEKLFNKPTTIAWAPSSQANDAYPEYPLGAIFKAWYRYHDNEPNYDYDHFFAGSVQITANK